MQIAKDKLRNIVKSYCTIFADEFKLFKKQISNKKGGFTLGTGELRNTDMIKRPLYEIPENLEDMIKAGLEEDELRYLKTVEGGRWFTKTFSDFSLISKV